MSVSVDLADAIVAALNDPTNNFVFNFKAKREAAPLTAQQVDELDGLLVLVFTGSIARERNTRTTFRNTYKPIIAVHFKLDATTAEANLEIVDQLVELTEQIAARLENENMAGLCLLSFNTEQDNELYSPEALNSLNLIVHALTLEYTTG